MEAIMKDTYISEAVKYIGADDTTLDLFESQYQIPNGVSYNSYVILDEKVAVMDTIDERKTDEWFANLENVLNGRTVDYLVISHLEPDHAANIKRAADKFPQAQLVLSAKAKAMLPQFFDIAHLEERCLVVKEGDTLELGTHKLHFVMAPMVHWPEAMVSYDTVDKILFSADGFGTFGAINGNLFADEVDFERDWLDDARRYFINIVGKYGVQVQNLLKKAATLEIKMICPLHGPIWRENLGWFIEKYDTWSSYKPEDQAVMIAYASIYGNTENAAEILASKLADKGVKNISMYDVSVTDPSVIVSESFRCSHLVFAAPSYNGGIFTKMETVLSELKAHSLQNRTVAIMENGTWAPVAGRQMREIFAGMKNIELLEEGVTIRSAVKEAQEASLEALAEKIASSLQ